MSCLIVEDQRPAQRVLERYIADTPQLALAATCRSVMEASEALAEHKIALMFLDLHLPKIQGFEFLRALPAPPLVIVTTADADHALEGYDLNVVDYLLKPFSFERFLQALAKAQSARAGASGSSPLRRRAAERDIFVKSGGDIRRIAVDDVLFIKAESDYVEIFTTSGRIFAAQTLKNMEQLLPGDAFLRVHKSYIVGLSSIDRITSSEIHVGGATIPIGRSFKETLLRRINA